MPQVEIDVQTARTLEFAARMAGVTPGQVIARLVEQASLPGAGDREDIPAGDSRVAVHAVYEGHRTNALFDPETHRVEIVSGPLAGTSYKSPTGAARAIVSHHNPTISPARNGWSFLVLSDGSGRTLQSIRH
ncbi:hypothetical protein CFP65_2770 [Kitasatospora sp. MMS16-BH015]|uniref:hypothetical protein n=1 Tax=Kitasatospora sp. MMS16-BH015 TaxID=2018025 RepID=UPI000CA3775E|nr:hypothetical protein [Kitasatospora sp. MMS16-BH015]AUG77589.1 hypothetical protein CFP65_2770 [Kitasatospora sp. MMS16-BH015]